MPQPPCLRDDDIVVRRPHFRLVDGKLFFLASNRPVKLLDSEESRIWNAIANPVTGAFLRARYLGRSDTAIANFLKAGLCDITERCRESRKRILVIEPHADDAALSVGGMMLLNRQDFRFSVATIANRSNFTSYYYLDRNYFDPDLITQLRTSESQCVAKILDGEHIAGPMTDAPLRYRDEKWSLDFFRSHRGSISASTARTPHQRDYPAWIAAIRNIIVTTEFDELWIPLGSPHIDHSLVAGSCFKLIATEPRLFADCKIRVYEDVPYSSRFPDQMACRIKHLSEAGFSLKAEVTPVDKVWADKIRLVSVYASQFKIEALSNDISASAEGLSAKSRYAERLWHLTGAPTEFDPATYEASMRIESTERAAIAKWISRHRDTKVLRLVLQAATGRWSEDLQLLQSMFPKARFEIYASQTALAEISEMRSVKTRIHVIASNVSGWISVWSKLAFARPFPIVMHVGHGALVKGKALASSLPCSTIVIDTMNKLTCSFSAPTNGR